MKSARMGFARYIIAFMAAGVGRDAVVAARSLNAVIIGATVERFEKAAREIAPLGLNKVRWHVPQPYASELIATKWHNLKDGDAPPPTELRMLSLVQANEDILDMAAGEAVAHNRTSKDWWLLFEDDVMLSVDPVVARESITHVLTLAEDDGIATMGMCAPQQCASNVAFAGVEYAKCKSACTHAMAYSAVHASRWRKIFGHQVEFTDTTVSSKGPPGGVWSAGLNISTGGDHFGRFKQDNARMGSLITGPD